MFPCPHGSKSGFESQAGPACVGEKAEPRGRILPLPGVITCSPANGNWYVLARSRGSNKALALSRLGNFSLTVLIYSAPGTNFLDTQYNQLRIIYAMNCVVYRWTLFLILAVSPAALQAQTWSGLGTTPDWSDASNWLTVVPANDGSASIVFDGGENSSPNVDAAWNVSGISFQSNAAPYFLNGSALTIQGGGILNNDEDLQTFGNAINLGTAQVWDAQFGGFQFNGTISQGANALTLSGPFAFLMTNGRSGAGNLLLRDNATVTQTAAVTSTGGTTISASDTGAIYNFSAANQLASGGVAINNNGRLRLLDTGGSTVTLANEFTWNGNRFAAAISPVIEVQGANDVLRITNGIDLTGRQGIVKEGPGTLRYTPAALLADSRWSLGIREGTVVMNQLPYRSGQDNILGQATGDLDFLGNSTLRVLFDNTIILPDLALNPGRYGYGFANVRVASNATATIAVDAGAVFKTSGRTDSNQAFLGTNSTLVLSGADSTSLFQFGVGNSGGSIRAPLNSTIDLRGGTLSFFGVDKTFWPQSLTFTMMLNGGIYDGRQQSALQSLPGNLVINGNPSSTTPAVIAFIINDTGGANASHGNLQWSGTLQKTGALGDTLTFNRNRAGSGTAGYVSLASNAMLDIQGGTVTVAGGQDVFTDSFDPARHVNVALGTGTVLNANRDIGIGQLTGSGSLTTSTAGAKTVVLESASNASFGGLISDGSGSLAIAKRGAGTQTFTTAQTYTGATTIASGAVRLSGAGSLLSTSSISVQLGDLILDNTTTNNLNRLGNSTPISLGSGSGTGSLQFLGNSSAASSETTGVLSANTGSGIVSITPGAGQTASLTFGGLTQAAGGTMDFRATSGTLGGGGLNPSVFITGQAAGLVGGWATVGSSFAEYTLANGIRAYAAANFNYDSNTGSVRDIDVTMSQILTGNDNENSVRYTGAFDTDFGGFAVNIFSGGLIKADATTSVISNGTLTAGNLSAADLSVSVITGGILNIDAPITDNPGAAVGLTKSDFGTLNLGAVNTFSNHLYLNQGTVGFSADNQLGSAAGDLFFNGGTLKKTTGAGDITLGNGRTVSIANGTSATFDITGGILIANTAGQFLTGQQGSLVKAGSGVLSLRAASTSFDGSALVNGGILEMRDTAALGDSADLAVITLAGGSLRTVRDGASTFGHDLIVNASSTLDVQRETGAGSTNATHVFGNMALNNSPLTVTSDPASLYAAQVGSLAVSGGASEVSVTANGNFSVANALTGNGGFTKSGTGGMALLGASNNTYTGVANVTGGQLNLGKTAGVTAITQGLNITGAASTVRLQASNQIADTSAVNITSGILNLDGFSETVGSLAGSGSVLLGSGTLAAGALNTDTTYSGTLSGAGGFTKQGTGVMTLSGANAYTGATLVERGTLRTTSNERISNLSTLLVLQNATFDVNGNDETVAGLAGAGAVTLDAGELTLIGSATTSFSGIISGSGDLRVVGGGTQVLSGGNTFGGSLTVTNGSRVTTGATLVLDSGVELILDSSTFDSDGFSQGLDSLTLTDDSTLDFGNRSSVLTFASSTANFGDFNSNTLTVTDWTGTIGVSGGVDQFIYANGLSSLANTTTSQIRFIIGPNTYDGLVLSRLDLGINFVEIVPIPEPQTAALVVLAVGLLAMASSRRSRRNHPVSAARTACRESATIKITSV